MLRQRKVISEKLTETSTIAAKEKPPADTRIKINSVGQVGIVFTEIVNFDDKSKKKFI